MLTINLRDVNFSFTQFNSLSFSKLRNEEKVSKGVFVIQADALSRRNRRIERDNMYVS